MIYALIFLCLLCIFESLYVLRARIRSGKRDGVVRTFMRGSKRVYSLDLSIPIEALEHRESITLDVIQR